MSINAFKEALKRCKTNLSSSSSSSQIPQQFNSSIISRKPPKSSLSRQLSRLQEDTDFYPQNQLKSLKREANFDPVSENNDANDGDKETGKENTKLESFCHHDHTGANEPLVLSLPGEIPVVQVPSSINSRLMEHQRGGVRFLYTLYSNNNGGVLGDDMCTNSLFGGYEKFVELP